MLFFALPSCNKDAGKSYTLALNTGYVTITIPPTAPAILDTFGSGITNYNIDSFIKAGTGNSSLGLGNISSVKLASCVLTMISGANYTSPTVSNSFGNFGSCTALFSSNTNTTPYEIGVAHNPATYTTTLTMPADSTTELKSFFAGSQFKCSMIGDLGITTTDTIKCTVQFLFNMYIQG